MKFHRNTLTLEKDGSTRFSEWRTGHSCQTCPDFEVNFVRLSRLYPYIAHRHTHRAGPGLPREKKDQLNCASSSMAPEFWGGWLIHVRRFELVERKINLLLPSIKPWEFYYCFQSNYNKFQTDKRFSHPHLLPGCCCCGTFTFMVGSSSFCSAGVASGSSGPGGGLLREKKGSKNRLLPPEYCYDKASSMSRPLTSPFSPSSPQVSG